LLWRNIRIRGDPKVEEYIHKHVFHSVRNRVLQKLLLLYFNLWGFETELHEKVEKRLADKKLVHDKASFAYEITPEEVSEVIGCSRRTAIEYVDALKTLMQ